MRMVNAKYIGLAADRLRDMNETHNFFMSTSRQVDTQFSVAWAGYERVTSRNCDGIFVDQIGLLRDKIDRPHYMVPAEPSEPVMVRLGNNWRVRGF